MAIAKAAAGDYQSALELLTRAARLAPQRSDIRSAHFLITNSLVRSIRSSSMAKNQPAQLALGDNAARQLANATKTVPQLSTISPRCLSNSA